jgi:hypothetical protein
MDTQSNTKEAARTPAYVSFKSFTNFIADQKEHGLPNRIDRSVLTKFSGGVGNQLISALKFLGLIDDEQSASAELNALVEAYGTESWPTELGQLIRRAYAPIVANDLASATPAQFHEAFRNSYQATGDVMRKCEAFFLNAAQAAQTPINARIIKHRAPRTIASRRHIKGLSKQPSGGPKRQAKTGVEDENEVEIPTDRTAYETLIEILDPASMDKVEQDAVFTLIAYLRRRELDE